MWLPPFPERARADWLARFGLSRVWGDRLQDAQHVLQGVYQKFGLESARADPFCDGYCFWTLVDVVVPLDVGVSGQGWLTPFWEPKSKGLTPNDFAAFNSPDCLVADLPLTNRVFASGDAFRTTIGLARYGNAHLCCQERLWDGIKRDRLVWMGDAHPETMAILNVFGSASVLPETFDYAVAVTDPSRQWMNNVASYTLWWLRNLAAWHRFTGDADYLARHHRYLSETVARIVSCITPSNTFETADRTILDCDL